MGLECAYFSFEYVLRFVFPYIGSISRVIGEISFHSIFCILLSFNPNKFRQNINNILQEQRHNNKT